MKRSFGDRLDPMEFIETYKVIADQLAKAIATGYYGPDCPFPSSRVLAKQYGVSRTTILAAFGVLSRQGLMILRQGAAPRVVQEAPDEVGSFLSFDPGEENREEENQNFFEWRTHLLPERKWFALLSNAGRDGSIKCGGRYGQPVTELKIALRNYLSRQRQIRVGLGQLFIFDNASHALRALARVLIPGNDTRLIVDAPTVSKNVRQLALFTNDIQPVYLDGLSSEELSGQLSQRAAQLLYITTSIRFGASRSLNKANRQDIVDWAARESQFILEHDCGHEYCSGPSSHPSLFALDKGNRVIYLADFCRSLSPLTNICAAIVPEPLTHLFRRQQIVEESVCRRLEYMALSELLNTGYLERHSRKVNHTATLSLSRFKEQQAQQSNHESKPNVRLLRTGKEAVIEFTSEPNKTAIQKAIASKLLLPARELYGWVERRRHCYLISADRLEGDHLQLIMACLNESEAEPIAYPAATSLAAPW